MRSGGCVDTQVNSTCNIRVRVYIVRIALSVLGLRAMVACSTLSSVTLLLSSLIGMDSWLCYNDYLYVCERDFTGLLAGEVGPVLPDSKRGGAHPDYAPRAAYGSTDGGFALVGYSLSPPSSSSPSHRSMGDAARPWSCWPRSRKGFARFAAARMAPPAHCSGAGRASSLRLVTRCAEEAAACGSGTAPRPGLPATRTIGIARAGRLLMPASGHRRLGGRRRFGRCGEDELRQRKGCSTAQLLELWTVWPRASKLSLTLIGWARGPL